MAYWFICFNSASFLSQTQSTSLPTGRLVLWSFYLLNSKWEGNLEFVCPSTRQICPLYSAQFSAIIAVAETHTLPPGPSFPSLIDFAKRYKLVISKNVSPSQALVPAYLSPSLSHLSVSASALTVQFSLTMATHWWSLWKLSQNCLFSNGHSWVWVSVRYLPRHLWEK